MALLSTYGYTDERHPDISNLPKFVLPDYERWDMRAIWDLPNGRWSLTAFAKNILDQIAVKQWRPQESGGANPHGTLTDEREIGFQVLARLF